ncbi:hypothetical protein [Komagataeibacter xylinus]|uniref:Uncharacterized protein n=1 Tax=Komagataeibacter xylinus TaxID=28448 RepID=A0A857FSK1_KOMXY|nr:hypothetical protein [Komagataeibacter xylinus]QHC37096.1 hypothetical protein FMA36_07615 [Komagataeibacter xylinus]
MAQQLDLVDFIAGLPMPAATAPQLNPLDLLPRRPKAWERLVAHVPAEDVRISVSPTWTRVVVEQLREDGCGDQLLGNGKIRSHDVPPDLIWPEPCRLILMTADSAARIHERWCLEEAPGAGMSSTFRFAQQQHADRTPVSQQLRLLAEEQS